MSQIYLCGDKDLQSIEPVGELVQTGIEAICKIYTTLINADVDRNTGSCSDDEQIRKHIEHAEKCMKTSDKMIQEKLAGLDKCMEQLLKDKHHAEQEKQNKNLVMDKLHKDKTCAEEILHTFKAALMQAEKSLASVKQALEKEEARRKASTDLTTAGAIMFIIPIIGWIAGLIMISEGEFEQHEALKGIRAAEKEIEKAISQMREYNSKVSDYQSRITETENEIEKTNEGLSKIQKKIEELQQHLVVIVEIQEKVREAVHLLSVLAERATVLEKQTQRFIIWEPVMKVMKDVMKAALNIIENKFLYSQGLPELKNTLRQNIDELFAISNHPFNSYY